MIKILFVCHGNICRSPMAEFVMKDIVKKLNIADKFEIASAATSTEEIGNPVYPPARKKLAEELSLSEWQILTALDKLKSTGEIAITTTNKFTVITLKNWQNTGQEPNFFKARPTTNPQQKHNKSTHLNNIKNEKNVKNNGSRARERKNDIYNGSIDWSKMDMIINN